LARFPFRGCDSRFHAASARSSRSIRLAPSKAAVLETSPLKFEQEDGGLVATSGAAIVASVTGVAVGAHKLATLLQPGMNFLITCLLVRLTAQASRSQVQEDSDGTSDVSHWDGTQPQRFGCKAPGGAARSRSLLLSLSGRRMHSFSHILIVTVQLSPGASFEF